MKTAAAYIRVSTEEQTELSPDSQLRQIRSYAASHQLVLPDTCLFIDNGISGRTASRRPAFQQMIRAARTTPRPFDLILVWKFSRFARNRQDSIVYKSLLRKECGVEVVSITEQLGHDSTAILMEALLEAMDEYYSVNLGQEVCRGMQEKFSRGGVITRAPFGYRMEDGQYQPDEETAPAVRMIFRDFAAGSSCRSIAGRLNRMGYRTINGRPFESRTVSYILSNPVYLGMLRRADPNGSPPDRYYRNGSVLLVPGTHPPLIPEELYSLAVSRLRSGSAVSSSSAPCLLQGLVRCSSCGSLLVRSGRGTFQCGRYSRGLCPVSHSVNREELTDTVLAVLCKDLGDPLLTLSRSPAPDPGFSSLLSRKRHQLTRLREAYESGADTLAEYRERKEELLAEIRELERFCAGPSGSTSQLQLTLSEFFCFCRQTPEREEIGNRLLHSLLARVVFDRKQSTVRLDYRTEN